MTRAEALVLLELSPAADAAAVDAALRARVDAVRERLATAPTRSLRATYTARLDELTEAARLLGRPLPAPSAAPPAPGAAPARAAEPRAGQGAPVAAQAVPRGGRGFGKPWLYAVVVAGVGLAAAGWSRMHAPAVLRDAATGVDFVEPRGAVLAVGRTEVTRAQFARFVAATRHVTDAERSGSCHVYAGGTAVPRKASWRDASGSAADAPVVCVSWNDAGAFAAWASAASGTDVRLPTEAEWASAAAAGATGRYSFGDDSAGIARHANIAGPESGLPWAQRLQRTDGAPGVAAVATYAANDFGLFDMHGNVWEWTADSYSPTQRVIRGGSWASHPANATLRARNAMPPDEAGNDVGFRVVRPSSRRP